MELRLRDGAAIEIREIRPSDKPLLALGLERLSPETVQRRFLAPKTRFTASELRYLTEVDGCDHYAVVALGADGPDDLVAVARLVRIHDHPEAAEAAIVVADSYQGRGLGRELALLLADAARARGFRRIVGTYRADNTPALKLMATIAARLETGRASGGTVEAVAELAA